MAKVVDVSDEKLNRDKTDIAARCVQAEVVGDQPVRDAITKESIEPGGTVSLDPKFTNIAHLVSAGVVKLLKAQA